MNAYDKIRAALEMARELVPAGLGMPAYANEALAALAKLEKAAAEPVATVCLVTDRFAHNHCIEVQLQVDPCAQLPIGTKLYAAPPAPVAEIREVVVTDEVAKRVMFAYHHNPVREDNAAHGRDMIAAVRAELGPTLGLVELKEPTPEECERICSEYERLLMREGTCGGRDAFDACRAVLWPKEGL